MLVDFGEDNVIDTNQIDAIHTPQNKSKEWHTVVLKNGHQFDIHHNVYLKVKEYLKDNQQINLKG